MTKASRTMQISAALAQGGLSALRIVLAIALAGMAGPSVGEDKCDNKLEQGEGPGPFFGIEAALYMYALAEKACGAPIISMSTKMLAFVEKEGCGPDTPVYVLLRDSIRKMEESDLRALAQEGRADSEISAQEVQAWARQFTEELGGCPALLEFHKHFESAAPRP